MLVVVVDAAVRGGGLVAAGGPSGVRVRDALLVAEQLSLQTIVLCLQSHYFSSRTRQRGFKLKYIP